MYIGRGPTGEKNANRRRLATRTGVFRNPLERGIIPYNIGIIIACSCVSETDEPVGLGVTGTNAHGGGDRRRAWWTGGPATNERKSNLRADGL